MSEVDEILAHMDSIVSGDMSNHRIEDLIQVQIEQMRCLARLIAATAKQSVNDRIVEDLAISMPNLHGEVLRTATAKVKRDE